MQNDVIQTAWAPLLYTLRWGSYYKKYNRLSFRSWVVSDHDY